MKPVFIRWVDSGRSDGWESPDSALQDARETSMACETVAWLVGQHPEWVLVSSSRRSDEEVLSTLQIPRCAITEIKELDLGVQANQDQAF